MCVFIYLCVYIHIFIYFINLLRSIQIYAQDNVLGSIMIKCNLRFIESNIDERVCGIRFSFTYTALINTLIHVLILLNVLNHHHAIK